MFTILNHIHWLIPPLPWSVLNILSCVHNKYVEATFSIFHQSSSLEIKQYILKINYASQYQNRPDSLIKLSDRFSANQWICKRVHWSRFFWGSDYYTMLYCVNALLHSGEVIVIISYVSPPLKTRVGSGYCYRSTDVSSTLPYWSWFRLDFRPDERELSILYVFNGKEVDAIHGIGAEIN